MEGDMARSKNEFHDVVDREFENIVAAMLKVVEHEKVMSDGTTYLSEYGSLMMHEALDIAKASVKELI